jgi:hypothetical protein
MRILMVGSFTIYVHIEDIALPKEMGASTSSLRAPSWDHYFTLLKPTSKTLMNDF